MIAPRPQPHAADEQLLSGRAYAVAWGGGLSSRHWRIVDEDGRDTLAVARERDPVRSFLTAAMLVVVLFGAGGGLLVARIGSTGLAMLTVTALTASVVTLLTLGPVVAFRRPRPVIVRDAESAAPLLTVHRRTRFALTALIYDVLTPAGHPLGTIRYAPMRNVVRTAWQITPDGGTEPITLTEPSAVTALQSRASRASLFAFVAMAVLRGLRWLRSDLRVRRTPRPALHAIDAAAASPLASCTWDESGHWLWVQFSPAAPLPHRWLILAACLFAVIDENG